MSDDLISRQATIDALNKKRIEMMQKGQDVNRIWECLDVVAQVPSAQPELPREIQDILDYLDTVLHPIISPENWNVYSELHDMISSLPSAQPDYQEVLGWLLEYHTKSFDLHGRYLPHEVISWLINDFTQVFIAEREHDG